MNNTADQPYNELPFLPPQTDIESKKVLKATISAQIALAELRSAAKTIPDDSMLVRSIALQEARVSSEIEQIVTTNDELYRSLNYDESSLDPPTKEVLRYGEAVWLGYAFLTAGNSLSIELLEKLGTTILQKLVQVRQGKGTRIGDARSGRVVYTPPVGEARIRGLLENLLAYMQSESGVDPVVRMSVAHYQFEAIHPFPDSNGRVGRVLNILFLIQQGLINKPILYLSRPIVEDKARYYGAIRAVTEHGRWEEWVLYMLENLTDTATETRRRIEAINEALAVAVDRAKLEMQRGYSMELIRLVFSQPYTRISNLEKVGIAKRQAASAYLQELERIGLLESHRLGREVLFVNSELLRILTL